MLNSKSPEVEKLAAETGLTNGQALHVAEEAKASS